MQLTIEDISPVEKRVEFELPWRDVAPRLDKAYDTLRRQVHLRGFRPGKAPRAVLEKLYREKVEEDVARELIELSLGQAIKDKQLMPVAPPRVDKLELKRDTPFKFSALVEVRSEVVPKDYSGLALEKRPIKVTDEDVTAQVENYRRQLTEFIAVTDRDKVADDDLVMIEVAGRVGPHKIKKRSVVVDLTDPAGGPLPGLGPQLRGISTTADNLEIKYTIDEGVRLRELAGKEVTLRVTVKEARARKVPPLDDSLAKDSGEAETLAGLKEKIRARLHAADERTIRSELHRAIVKEIVKRNEFPIATALVTRFANNMLRRLQAELGMAGVDLEGTGLDQEKLFSEMRPQAEEEARASVLLAAIAEREGISVSEADLHKRVAELAAARQVSAKQLRGELEENGQLAGVRRMIQDEKTLDLVLSQAKVTDADPSRLIVTPEEARSEGRKLIVSPEEAAREAGAGTQAGEPARGRKR